MIPPRISTLELKQAQEVRLYPMKLQIGAASRIVNLKLFFLVAFLFVVGGCRSRMGTTAPAIEFSKIPPAAQGGRERVDTISGRAVGAHAGQHVVVYARSGPWWVQPWPDQPLISIQADSTWSTQTHLGI